jgi:eukaryotic-like serine/threonine-protein kinase
VTPQQYARSKELFLDLLEKSHKEREAELRSLEAKDAELASTVRGLLASHFSRTIIMGATGKVSNTTTQSRTFGTVGLRRVSSNLFGGIVPLAVTIGSLLFLFAIGTYLQSELKRRNREEYKTILTAMTAQKASLLIQWVRGNELRLQDWGKQRQLQELVVSLNEKIQNGSLPAAEREEILMRAPEHLEIKSLIERYFHEPMPLEDGITSNQPNKDVRFAIWNRSLLLLSDWQFENPKVGLGSIATPVGASMLTQVFDKRETSVELPRPTAETVSRDYPLETTEQYMMFFLPIFAPDESGQVIGAMMIRSSSFVHDLQELIDASVLVRGNVYLIDQAAAIATKAEGIRDLSNLELFKNNPTVHGSPIMESRDPGGDLLRGFKPTGDVQDWQLTKPGRMVAQARNGSDLLGYRDYRGKDVVGAWQWIAPLQRMLVLELPQSEAFKTAGFIDSSFRYLYGLPLLISSVLVGLSIRRAFTKIDLTNKALGAYKLKEKIGEGGLGIVYKGEHGMLGRTAAIKLIKEPFANASAMRRFEREVRMAAKLSHPNTVSVYDFGISKGGLPFCAMELVEGVNLAHFIAYDPKIPIDRCIWILRQICGAVEEAHSVGLIHRDIKPQNIMVCQKGQLFDLVKVVDFGLAKTMADNTSRDVTATRVLIGTPGFIAPERLETPWIADPRIDIFAFGVLGVYLLSGKVPMLGVTHDSLMAMLSLGRFTELASDPNFSKLIWILAKCLSPDPIDRPSSMSDVGSRLESLASFLPWNENLAERWWKTNGDDILAFARTHDAQERR